MIQKKTLTEKFFSLDPDLGYYKLLQLYNINYECVIWYLE